MSWRSQPLEGQLPPTRPEYQPNMRLARLSFDYNQIPSEITFEQKRSTYCTFDPSGSVLVVGFEDGHVEFWNLEMASKIGEFQAHTRSRVNFIKFTQRDKLLTYGNGLEIKCWDINISYQMEPPVLLQTWKNAVEITAVAFKHDKTGFLTYGKDHTVRLWNYDQPSHVALFKPKQRGWKNILGAILSEDDKNSLYVSEEGAVYSLSIPEANFEANPPAEQIYAISVKGTELRTASFFPTDWKKMIVGFSNALIQVIDVDQKVVLRTVQPAVSGNSNVFILRFYWSSDYNYIAATSGGCLYKVWNCETWTLQKKGKFPFSSVGFCIAPGNDVLVYQTPFTNHIEPLIMEEKRPPHEFSDDIDYPRDVELEGRIHSFAFCKTRSLVALVMEENNVVIMDCNIEGVKYKFQVSEIGPCQFTPDGNCLVVAGQRNLRMWDIQSGSEVSSLTLKRMEVIGMTFHCDGNTLLYYGSDSVRKLRSYNFSQETPQEVFRTEQDTQYLEYSPDGQKILMLDRKSISVCNSQDFENVLFTNPTPYTGIGCWFTDSETFAACALQTVHVGNVTTGSMINFTLERADFKEEVLSISFLPSGTEILVGLKGGSCLISHIPTGLLIQHFNCFIDTIYNAVYVYDPQHHLVVGAILDTGYVRLNTPHKYISSFGPVLTATCKEPVPPIVFNTILHEVGFKKRDVSLEFILEKVMNKDGILIDWEHPVKWKRPLKGFNGVSFLGSALSSKERTGAAAYIKWVCAQVPGTFLCDLTQYIAPLFQEFSDLAIELLETTRLSCKKDGLIIAKMRGYDIQHSAIKRHLKYNELIGQTSYGIRRGLSCFSATLPFDLTAEPKFLQQIVRSPQIPSTVWNCFALKCLLTYKWHTYGKWYYMSQFLLYLLYLFLFCLVTLPDYPYGENYPTSSKWDKARIFFEVLLVLFSFLYIGLEGWQAKKNGIVAYLKSPFNLVDLATHSLVIISMIIRWSGDQSAGYVAAVVAIFVWFKLIVLTRGFQATGVFVRMLFAIIRSIVSFLSILLLMIVAFAHGFYLLNSINQSLPEYNTIGHSLLAQYRMLIGDFDISEMLSSNGAGHILGVIFFIAFTFVATIILLNVLIALLSNSYEQVIENAEAEWLAELAEILLDIEENFLRQTNSHINFPKKLEFAVPQAAYQKELAEKGIAVSSNIMEHKQPVDDTKLEAKKNESDIKSEENTPVKDLLNIISSLTEEINTVRKTLVAMSEDVTILRQRTK